jgi:pSer/pThr/pTyr-binding forkhead associated (FHA) protein
LRKRQPQTRTRSSWEVVVAADRDQFEQVRTPDITFPRMLENRVIALDRPEVQIGRRSADRGIEPDVDLSEPPADPGVSHLHALLVRQDDGSYAVMDLGSTNGTTLNDQPEPIMANTPIPLTDGDRIRLGAWTTITIRSCARRDRRDAL